MYRKSSQWLEDRQDAPWANEVVPKDCEESSQMARDSRHQFLKKRFLSE
jgi:hypothetical protein